MNPLFAASVNLGGSGMAHDIFAIFIFILIGLILWALGNWGFPKLGAPPIVMTVWNGLFVLVGAVIVINFLAGLAGHRFIEW